MHIFLDTNVFIADLWLQSQNFRILIDYTRKTSSTIVIDNVVEKELNAHTIRHFQNQIKQLETALRNASRNHLVAIPDIQSEDIFNETWKKWESNFIETFNQVNTIHLETQPVALEKALDRAIERIAPCKNTGEGMRDAIIWLNFLNYCMTNRLPNQFVFISGNTTDFADSDKLTLHPRLKEDVKKAEANILFYPSLESFLQAHAQPVSHITLDWLKQQIDMNVVEEFIADHIENWSDREANSILRISNSSLGNYYRITSINEVGTLDLDLVEFFVWQVDQETTEVTLVFDSYIEAIANCERTPLQSDEFIKESSYFEDYYPWIRNLDCTGEVGFSVSASLQKEGLELIEIEDMYRL